MKKMDMKSVVLSLLVSVICFSTNAQISGDIKEADRSLINDDISFVIEGNHTGKFVYNFSVDSEGIVTSAKVDRSKSTISSTPSEMKARKYVQSLKFEKGTHFPKYHQGRIVITMVRPRE